MRKLKALQHYVSVARLEKKGACLRVQQRFTKTFPKPVRITRRNLQKAARWIHIWWFETRYLGLSDSTSTRLNIVATNIATEHGVAKLTLKNRDLAVGYKRIRLDVLADYLGLP